MCTLNAKYYEKLRMLIETAETRLKNGRIEMMKKHEEEISCAKKHEEEIFHFHTKRAVFANPKAYTTLSPGIYTCGTCYEIFLGSKMRRMHYDSEWHRYNLNRKVTGLPSITLQEFEEKVASQHLADKKEAKKIVHCNLCRKKYNCEKQYKNHLTSTKHKKNMEINAAEKLLEMEDEDKERHSNRHRVDCDVKKYAGVKTDRLECETDSDVSVVSQWQFEIPMHNYCLFCNRRKETIFHNLVHMKKKHSFFIPDEEYCKNYKGLIKYLGEKIRLQYKCLWCNDSGKQMRSAAAARSHMIDKGHCKMLFEGEVLNEYKDFYDFSSSYPDCEDLDVDPDEELPDMEDFLSDEGYELKLPSGKIIGHRTLVRYYKQYLKTEVSKANSPKDITGKKRNMMIEYNSLGGKPEAVIAAKQKRMRDIQYLHRVYAKYSTQLQSKQNKLQKHFRSQTNVY